MIDGPDVRPVFVLILNDQTEQIWQSENEFDRRQLLKTGEGIKPPLKLKYPRWNSTSDHNFKKCVAMRISLLSYVHYPKTIHFAEITQIKKKRKTGWNSNDLNKPRVDKYSFGVTKR